MITIERYNEVFNRVYSDDSGIEQELSDFFTFQVEGYRYMPAYKSGSWDGKKRLYDLRRKTLYTGLTPYLLEFANRNGYEIKDISKPREKENVQVQEIKEFVTWLNLHGRGKPIEAHDYQIDAITHGINAERCVLKSPTASGKSLIIYSLIRWHLEQKRKCLVIVPTTSLVEQMYGDFQDYSTANGWRTDKHCQRLYSGFSKEFESDVLISTWQSLYKQPKNWFNQFDVVIGDEAHTYKATAVCGMMESMTNIRYRIGTTGTIDNKKLNKLVLEGIFGTVYSVITTKELMDSGKVAKLKIKCIILKHDEAIRKAMKKMPYQAEMDFLVSDEKRNKFIRNLAVSCEGNTIVLFQLVQKHGKVLFELIKNKVGENRKVFFIAGGTDVEEREAIRHITDKEDNAIIVASYGTSSTGTNIPSIENVIFGSPSKSKIRNLQTIGRGLRLKEGKTHCNLFDIADNLSWKSSKNHTLNHLEERVKIYAEEKFDFKLMEIDL